MIFREIKDLFNYHSKFTERIAKHDVKHVFKKTFSDLASAGFIGPADQRILDLGCGQRFHFALQCAASGANVTALDLDYIKPDPFFLALFRIILHNGLNRALKSSFRKLLFDSKYYQQLEEFSGRPLLDFIPDIRFIISDPKNVNYPLPSETFNLICTNLVMEHVADIHQFAGEIRRLLVEGGFFYAIIHNYFSLSGGHNMEWVFPDELPSEKVPPWDHLRKNRYPAFVFLNRHNPEEFQDAFANHLEIVLFEGRDINHERGGLEGERILTPEISADLVKFPRNWLLTRYWCIICRK